MADDELLLVKSDQLSMAIHRGEVVAVFELSSAHVFPRKLGMRLLPEEARAFARQLNEWAAKAESALPRA